MEKSLYILILLCLVGCTNYEQRNREQAPLKVKTMVVTSQTDNNTSRYIGTVEPAKATPLSMQSAGRVVSINAKNGQRVKAGQTILAIDATQARNALATAEATLRHAQDGYNRVSQVHSKGVVSDQKMVEVESQLAQARSMYEAAKQQLNECTLTAPCDGVLDGLNVEKGQTIIPGTQLCSILDLSGFSVRFTVPEAEANGEWLKAKGTVECPALDTILPIVITEKSVTANVVTHTCEVVARIQGGAEILMSGMVGKVHITNDHSPLLSDRTPHGQTTTNSQLNIVIPANCVLLKQEGYTVWVVEQGCAVRRDIIVDGYLADGVRVQSGLQAGDTLIIEGYQKLYNDCKVVCD